MVHVNHILQHFNTKELSELVNKVYNNSNKRKSTNSTRGSGSETTTSSGTINENSDDRYDRALRCVMQDLFSHTRRMSMHNLMKVPLLYESISQCYCALFGVLLRHTGIVETMQKLVEKQINSTNYSTDVRSRYLRKTDTSKLPSELLRNYLFGKQHVHQLMFILKL